MAGLEETCLLPLSTSPFPPSDGPNSILPPLHGDDYKPPKFLGPVVKLGDQEGTTLSSRPAPPGSPYPFIFTAHGTPMYSMEDNERFRNLSLKKQKRANRREKNVLNITKAEYIEGHKGEEDLNSILLSMGEEVTEKKVKVKNQRDKTEKSKKGRKGSMRSIKEEFGDQDERNDLEKISDVQKEDLEESDQSVETSAGLVENIENWTLDQSNNEMLEIIKKQLKFGKIDLNNLKLVKNKCGDKDIAPMHAAVSSNSPELIRMVLETKGINPDPEYLCMGQLSGGILDYAVACNVKIEIIRMIMGNIEISVDLVNAYEEELPRSLVTAVKLDRLDIVKLLLRQQSKYPEFNSFSCLIVAIEDNNGRIFSKVLRKVGEKIDNPSGVYEDTMLHKCVKLNRVKMLRELVMAGCDVNVKNLDGLTPLTLAVFNAGFGCCGDGCLEKIISALLSAESVHLDVSVKEGGVKSRAIDYLNEKTCQHVRKLICEKEASSASKSVSGKSSKPDDNKICWSCSADPTEVTLWRCRGCLVAWYCGEKCQEEDWPVHGPWCEKKSSRREEKHQAKKDECPSEVKETFCDVD